MWTKGVGQTRASIHYPYSLLGPKFPFISSYSYSYFVEGFLGRGEREVREKPPSEPRTSNNKNNEYKKVNPNPQFHFSSPEALTARGFWHLPPVSASLSVDDDNTQRIVARPLAREFPRLLLGILIHCKGNI